MAKYTKITSNYIRTKKHQTLSDGSSIFERDWVTFGNTGKLERGKSWYYNDGNFQFTVNATKGFKKRHSSGRWLGSYFLPDVTGFTADVNNPVLSRKSNDLRSYAYYGSAVELVETSVGNILAEFPGRLRVTDNFFAFYDIAGNWYQTNYYIISNPFGIDMHTDQIELDEYTNEFRYLSYSWDKYDFIDIDGNKHNITGYVITSTVDKVPHPEIYHLAGYQYVFYRNQLFEWNDQANDYLPVDFSCDCENYFVKCNEYIRYRDEYYKWSDNDNSYNPINVYEICDDDYLNLHEIQITVDGFEYPVIVEAYVVDKQYVYITRGYGFKIQPKQEYIDEYFHTLNGFESKLLNRETKPLYTSKFLIPRNLNSGGYMMIERKITWPSSDYCIDVESSEYYSFLNKLYDIAAAYDEKWSDCIWRKMTHEAIKNFDWTYRRDYNEQDTEENIEGGNRMMDTLRLYGRVFDELKREIEGIKFTNNVSYDGNDNITNAELSDKTELHGWDNTSTIWDPYYYVEVSEIPEGSTAVVMPIIPTWVTDQDPEYISVGCEDSAVLYHKMQNNPNEEFLSDYFLHGTNESDIPWIEKQNPWITRNMCGYHYEYIGMTSPKPDWYWNSGNTYYNGQVPFVLTINSPEFVRSIANNGSIQYFRKRTVYEPSHLHDTWYGSRNPEMTTPASVDIEYQRKLLLSSARIFKSKGTLESIEMMMGMFGLGRDDDYTLTERHWSFSPVVYNSTFSFYELLDEEPTGQTWDDSNTFEEIPHATSDMPTYIRVGDSSGYLYYKLNNNYKLADLIQMLWENKNSENEYEDIYSGVPIGDVSYKSGRYIIPFYTQKRHYEGDVYFQFKGGWGKKDEDVTTRNNYEETVSYLHLLTSVSSLMAQIPRNLNDGDIYYVNDLSDYIDYDENVPYDLSHFFKVVDIYNPQRFASWVNIPMEGEIVYNQNYDNGHVTHEDYEHAAYLAGIIPTFIYNNPHVGYGNYDNGNEFLKYMRRPYTYLIENYGFDDPYYENIAKQIEYELTKIDTQALDGKVIQRVDTKIYETTWSYVPYEGETPAEYTVVGTLPENPTADSDEFILVGTTFYQLQASGETIHTDDGNTQYLNDKTLILHNVINNNTHRQFLREVVMKYVMQVIPSTTILILDNFEMEDDQRLVYYHIIGEPSNPTMGTTTGTGDYLQGTYAILTAQASEGYRFSKWDVSTYRYEEYPSEPPEPAVEYDEVPTDRIDGSFPTYIFVNNVYYQLIHTTVEYSNNNTIKVLVCKDMVYTAEFEVECGFVAECLTMCDITVQCILTGGGSTSSPVPPTPPTPPEPPSEQTRVFYSVSGAGAQNAQESAAIVLDYCVVIDDSCPGYSTLLANPEHHVSAYPGAEDCSLAIFPVIAEDIDPSSEIYATYPKEKVYTDGTTINLLACITGGVKLNGWRITNPNGTVTISESNPLTITPGVGDTYIVGMYETYDYNDAIVNYRLGYSAGETPEIAAGFMRDYVGVLDNTCDAYDRAVADPRHMVRLASAECRTTIFPVHVEDIDPDSRFNYTLPKQKAYNSGDTISIIAAVDSTDHMFKAWEITYPDGRTASELGNPIRLTLDSGITDIVAIYADR